MGATGFFFESAAHARLTNAEAHQREIQNAKLWLETYFERKRINQEKSPSCQVPSRGAACSCLMCHTSAATAGAQSVQLAPIEALTIDEGQTLLWRPTILNRGMLGADVRFRLDDSKPDGMEIDAETGTIQWQSEGKTGRN